MAFHVGRRTWQLAWDASRPAPARRALGQRRSRSTSSTRRAARSPRPPRRPTSRPSTSRASTRSPGRSTSRAPSPATSSRSSCSSSSRRTGAGPRASRASGCWRTTSRTAALRITRLRDGVGELLPGVRIPLAPFCGVLGLASPGEPRSTIPPTESGGNMDTRHLTAGSRLWLPVTVAGRAFSLGDGHAAQGDGEVCGTAIETPMRAQVRLTVRKDVSVAAPEFETPGPLGHLDEHGRLVRDRRRRAGPVRGRARRRRGG